MPTAYSENDLPIYAILYAFPNTKFTTTASPQKHREETAARKNMVRILVKTATYNARKPAS